MHNAHYLALMNWIHARATSEGYGDEFSHGHEAFLLDQGYSRDEVEALASDTERHVSNLGARKAGIPLSVIEGRTKLSDHFSREYIDWQCGRSLREQTA